MRRTKAFTLVELLVVVGIIGLLVAILVPTLQQARELANRAVCKGNLKSIANAISIYKTQYDNSWPWMEANSAAVTWEAATGSGTLQTQHPTPTTDRSITSLMFLLVREDQNPGLFSCPSDTNAKTDSDIYHDANGVEVYDFDFSSAAKVSYSWQCPVWKTSGSKWINGIDDTFSSAVVMADKTPKYDSNWTPTDITAVTSDQIPKHMSQNHSAGKRIMVLYAGLNVAEVDRPDVGSQKDHVYTASNDQSKGSQTTVSVTTNQHLSAKDSFLIGPYDE
jgi:prepilin-type N-terminal cleavage/methylation domain-containing protein